MISAVLEQKVWLKTSSEMPANQYIFLVGDPGVGKTRIVRAARKFLVELPDFHMAPTSMTAASLIDNMVGSRRMIPQLPADPLDYNTMTIMADELGTFMHQYDDEMVGVLSAFYDPDPYGQTRRGKEIKIKIGKPQLNILCGTTPVNLLKFIPENAWEQGFTSRIVLIHSGEKIVADDFAEETVANPADLIHDLKIINGLIGRFSVTAEYREALNAWRAQGEKPVPRHPKLVHYTARRKAHVYKLSMVSAIDRGNVLLIAKSDFDRALHWLEDAESNMEDIFKAGAFAADGKVMEEAMHYVAITDLGKGVSETALVRFLKDRVPVHAVMRVVEIMERSGSIKATSLDQRTGLRLFRIPPQGLNG